MRSFFTFFIFSLRCYYFECLVSVPWCLISKVTSGLCFAPSNGMEMGEMVEQNDSPETEKKVLHDGCCVVGM